MATKMGTGTKVALGVGVLAVVGGIGYYFWKKIKDHEAAAVYHPDSSVSFSAALSSQIKQWKSPFAPGTFRTHTVSGCPTSCAGIEATGKAVCNSAGTVVGFC